MNEAVKIFSFGSLLIESPVDESGEQFHAYVTSILLDIFGRLPDWLNFKIGRRFERNGFIYREFLCPAGSVDSRIQLHIQKNGGISRGIILRGKCSGKPYCSEIRLGNEKEFNCEELKQAQE